MIFYSAHIYGANYIAIFRWIHFYIADVAIIKDAVLQIKTNKKTKQTKTNKQTNKTKQNKTKQNKTKQNKTKLNKNKTKQNKKTREIG